MRRRNFTFKRFPTARLPECGLRDSKDTNPTVFVMTLHGEGERLVTDKGHPWYTTLKSTPSIPFSSLTGEGEVAENEIWPNLSTFS